MRLLEKAVLLRTIDSLWVEHLEAIEALKEGIGLRGYGQRDPLVEFKSESFELFRKLLIGIQAGVSETIYKVSLVQKSDASPMEKEHQEQHNDWGIGTNANSTAVSAKPKNKHRVGRNDPCPCGSGKKYKKCCGK